MKTGLVLEGGAMRGLFTAGVLDVFMENGISVDGAIGVSAGAVFGCNYKSRQIGRVLRYNLDYCNDKRYCSFRSLLKTGDLYGKDFCYNQIPNNLDTFDVDTYQNNPMDFYVVAIDIISGKPIYKKCDDGTKNDLEWYRASASMPIVSNIVKIGELELLDGGIADPIPLKHFESLGYIRNVVILTQPENYSKKPNRFMPVFKKLYNKYPDFIKVMENRHKIYNAQIEYVQQREEEGLAFVIRPPEKLPIRRIEHNPYKLRKAYEIGRNCAHERLDELKEFLKKSNYK